MAADQFYTGAYIEVIDLPLVTEIIDSLAFEGRDCTKKCNHSYLINDAKFCPSCGNKVNLINSKVEEETQWDMADLSDFVEDHLEWANAWGKDNDAVDSILVPRSSGIWGRFNSIDEVGYCGKIPQTTGYKDSFERIHAKILKKMKDKGVKFIIKEGILIY